MKTKSERAADNYPCYARLLMENPSLLRIWGITLGFLSGTPDYKSGADLNRILLFAGGFGEPGFGAGRLIFVDNVLSRGFVKNRYHIFHLLRFFGAVLFSLSDRRLR